MDKILEVKKLKIAFRTNSGALKAVRDISFDLERGRTLAIVGESGSGKSVTSRAIMGILAGNAIVEGGEIFYDGKDLMQISEEEMCHLRGDKISMIFQDPLSALNPIVKIGKQITEAMLLKNKTSRKEARQQLKKTLELLKKQMIAVEGEGAKARITKMVADVEATLLKGNELDAELNAAFTAAVVKALEHSANAAMEQKKAILPELKAAESYYQAEFERKAGLAYCKKLTAQVAGTIDRLEINKDSVAYTFGSSLSSAIDKYFTIRARNPKEEARYARQSARRDRLIARGKHVTWKVVPKNVYDLEELREGIALVVTRLIQRYESAVASFGEISYEQRAGEMVAYLKQQAQQALHVVTPQMAKDKAIELMEEVGIREPEKRYYQYPFEFSGGMRQRIVIAIALAADPDILICDEPTTALDVTIQAQILELIQNLKKERNLSVIFITHDLGVVANIADDIAVMYAGKIVEYGTAEDIFYDPRHPYTWALLSSMPDLDTKEKLDAIPGTPPNMIYPPVGDAFADRNRYAMKIDFEQQPPLFEVSPTHRAATWLLHPDAPKVEIPRNITERIARMNAKAEAAAAQKNGGAQE